MSSLHLQLKVRGTSLYPQAIFSVLDSLPEVQEYYVEVWGAVRDAVSSPHSRKPVRVVDRRAGSA